MHTTSRTQTIRKSSRLSPSACFFTWEKARGVPDGTQTAYSSEVTEFTPISCMVCAAQSLNSVLCSVLWIIVCLLAPFHLHILFCLFFDLQLQIIPLVSSNCSYNATAVHKIPTILLSKGGKLTFEILILNSVFRK